MRSSVVRERLPNVFPQLVEQILGGADADDVDAELARLPLPVAACFHLELSVGALFGLELESGARVAFKVHQPKLVPAHIAAVQAAQDRLTAASFPCPRPVLGPTPFLGRIGAAEEWLDDGAFVARMDSRQRRTMARLFARQVALLLDHPVPGVLTWLPQDERLWPTPHNALFDFAATRAGAEWIDEIAASARARHRAGPLVIAHMDWSAKHVRFRGDEATVVYDWDSISCDHESIAVGSAAATHTALLDDAKTWAPAVEEAVAFVEEYERERPLDEETRIASYAHAVYSVAYTARCEHALDAGGGSPRTNARGALAEFAAALL